MRRVRRRHHHPVRLSQLAVLGWSRWTPGLRNLTVLDDALSNIKANRGEEILRADLDDLATSNCSHAAHVGCLSLRGGPMRAMRSTRPDKLKTSPLLVLSTVLPNGMNCTTNTPTAEMWHHPATRRTRRAAARSRRDAGLINHWASRSVAQKVAGYFCRRLAATCNGKKKKQN